MVRKKNVLSVMMQCIFLMCLMTVIWALYGFSLSFGGKGGLVRRFAPPVYERRQPNMEGRPVGDADVAGQQRSSSSYMLFQCMFFIITPALICGAFAERMKFSTMVVFMILWGTFVYCPWHWVWGGGVLSYGSEARRASSRRGAWISPEERSSTSVRACRPWFAPCCWASGWATARQPCRRII